MSDEKPSKIEKLKARREGIEDTARKFDAVEDLHTQAELEEIRAKSEEKSKLAAALAAKQCTNCGQKGCFKVTSTEGKIRHLRCRGCAEPGKLVLE